jgi:hypothetical protein
MIEVTLAAALLRRKELAEKVKVLSSINKQELFEVKGKRVKVTEDIDDLVLQVPKLIPEEFTAAYDWHARQLRTVDLAIQQMNHTAKVEIPDEVMTDFKTTREKK